MSAQTTLSCLEYVPLAHQTKSTVESITYQHREINLESVYQENCLIFVKPTITIKLSNNYKTNLSSIDPAILH